MVGESAVWARHVSSGSPHRRLSRPGTRRATRVRDCGPEDDAMSRHIPRHARWNKRGPNEYTSGPAAVRFSKGAWWAHFSYQERDPDLPADHIPDWRPRSRR